MIGALIGDIIGSTREIHNEKTTEILLFPHGSHFTDDTVLSVATADKLLHEQNSQVSSARAYAMWFRQYVSRYPYAGYGQMFLQWAQSDSWKVQKSYGNGAAMRVTVIGWAFEDIKEVWQEVEANCHYTHHNKEAITGAKAVATAVFLAKKQEAKEDIKTFIEKKFRYTFASLDEIRESYMFDSRASYSVPPAIEAFLESDSYESAVRNAISIGGDSDTIACMAGGIAEAYYREIPEDILEKGKGFLDSGLMRVVKEFEQRFEG